LSNEQNKDIANIQFNFILEMTFGPACSFNATFSSKLALDGDHLLHKQEVQDNLYQNLFFSSPQLLKKTYNLFRCSLAQGAKTLYPQQPSKQNCPRMGKSTDDNSSSSSSDSDSSSSSDEDNDVPPIQSSILVINQKSHIVHAALQINSESITRSRFKIEDKSFEVNCGSSITGAPVKIITSISSGARVCQRKACLAALDHLLA